MELPKDFRKVLADVTNKRARFVIDTILSKGFCSTEDLKNAGYEHAPRAARDVRELGIYFMLLSPSANRDKLSAGERCENWTKKNISMFQTCYYAYPENYQHIAGQKEKSSILFLKKRKWTYMRIW